MHASQVGQHFNLRPNFELWKRHHYPKAGVEFYLYPTVGTVWIHSIKPELTEYDVIEYGGRSNWVMHGMYVW